MQTPLWKTILIWGICAAGLLFALPNLFYTKVEQHNDALRAVELAGGATPDQAFAIAQWPNWLPSGLVNLGLDLRGGAHLLAEVQVADVYKDRIDGLWPDVRDALRSERDAIGNVRREPSEPGVLKVKIGNPANMARAVELVRALAQPVVTLTGVGQTDIEVAGAGDIITVQLS
ncbi:MAG: protein translocase subunit SecD, partial [Cereibacter sp.]